jgi:hypothetical protein
MATGGGRPAAHLGGQTRRIEEEPSWPRTPRQKPFQCSPGARVEPELEAAPRKPEAVGLQGWRDPGVAVSTATGTARGARAQGRSESWHITILLFMCCSVITDRLGYVSIYMEN